MTLKPMEWAVLAVTLAYVAGFGLWFLTIGNAEFLGYVATLIAFIALIGAGQRAARFPPALLWALSLWGFLHMAGGGIRIDGEVLYALILVPLAGSGEAVVLRYDQVVHFYGFGVAALALRHLLRRHYPVLDGSRTLFAFSVLGSTGLGALNEIIEFLAVLALPETNVGGYYNTGLDLVFNSAGALCFAALAPFWESRGAA